uniref:thymidylate synthase n=1 Tax=viral metagenome TaxID=1070528 RepID=A0A6C0ARV0_9ZZZZ
MKVFKDKYSKYLYSMENKDRENNIEKVSANIFKNTRFHGEYQYLSLLENILENGSWEEGRNGRTTSIFGNMMRFSLKNNQIPILTTKKTAWKTCLKELLWFIKGQTDNYFLNEQGVHIWDGNASREFLDSRGLINYSEGILGPIYGFQWRNFNGEYDICKCKPLKNCYCNDLNSKPHRIDQLQDIIDALKDPHDRTSRRLIMTAWNPCQLREMALPPCHVLCQFNVHDGNKLSCVLYQRSVDTILGLPFNIASYALLTHLLAKHCGLEAYEFIHFMGNCHLYENAIDAAKLQIQREPYPFPTVSIKTIREKIEDYQVEDFEIHNYQSHDAIKVDMIA